MRVRRVDYRRVQRCQGNLGALCVLIAVFTAPFAGPGPSWACIGVVIGWALSQAVTVYVDATSEWREEA